MDVFNEFLLGGCSANDNDAFFSEIEVARNSCLLCAVLIKMKPSELEVGLIKIIL